MNLGELRQRVDRTSNLPSLPTVVTKIIAAVDDPRACVSRLNELIGQEPALATRMLRLANSAYFGRRNGIVSLSQCAVVLGFNTIRSLALSASVQRMVQQSNGKNFDPVGFWRHSLGTGVGARVLARRIPTDPEAAMAAGLVHDIGKLVLDVVAPREYELALADKKAGTSEKDAEVKHLGATHGEVGGWLAVKWKLPEPIVAAITWHHQPQSAGPNQALAALVMLADEVTGALEAGLPPAEVAEAHWQAAGIPFEEAEKLGQACSDDWKAAEELMGVGTDPGRVAA
jgi:putative nucleotidyltransferase with HDIG domain